MISPILDVYKKALLQRTLPLMVQYAEAHRKPRWLPVAKSKIYRIPKRPQISEEERLELLRLNNNYKTQMRGIRRFYREELVRELSSISSTTSEESLKRDAIEWDECLKLNKEWNDKISIEREERRAAKLNEMESQALSRMEAADRKLEKKIEAASAAIKKEIEQSKTFITRETLDMAIDEALANITDYNYAIDLKGQQHLGRETPIIKQEKPAKINN